MTTVMGVYGAVRRKLLFPLDDSLTDHIIADASVEVGDELYTELLQTKDDWGVKPFTLSVQADKDEYAIDAKAPGFGKASLIYTADNTGDTMFRARPIPIVSLPLLMTDYHGGWPGGAGVKHSAEALAFTYSEDNKQMLAKVGPTPQAECDYLVMYEPDVIRPQAETDPAFRLAKFDGFYTSKVAFACVGHCKWPGLSHGENLAQRRERYEFLGAEITRLDNLFRRYKRSSNQPNDYKRIGFGRSRR